MISNFGEGVLSNYEKEDNIGNFAAHSGKGAYGFVFKACDKRNKEHVAIKKVNI
jgi:hypothetical protein